MLCYAGAALGTAGALAQPAAAPLPPERVIRLAMMENIPKLTDQPQATLTQVYARLGYRLEVTPLPFARSLLAANYGDYDGELARLAQIEESAPQLKRVPVAVGYVHYVPYVMDTQKARLESWEAIRKSGLRIGARRGARLTESHVAPQLLTQVNSYDSLLAMLIMGRIDVVIAPEGQLEENFKDVSERLKPELGHIKSLPRFASVPLYHYVHERNAALIPALTAEITRVTARKK